NPATYPIFFTPPKNDRNPRQPLPTPERNLNAPSLCPPLWSAASLVYFAAASSPRSRTARERVAPSANDLEQSAQLCTSDRVCGRDGSTPIARKRIQLRLKELEAAEPPVEYKVRVADKTKLRASGRILNDRARERRRGSGSRGGPIS